MKYYRLLWWFIFLYICLKFTIYSIYIYYIFYFSKYFYLNEAFYFTGLALCLIFLLLGLTLYLFLSCMRNSTQNESKVVAKTESLNFNVSTGLFLFNKIYVWSSFMSNRKNELHLHLSYRQFKWNRKINRENYFYHFCLLSRESEERSTK